jgi:hypothetical protein
MKLLEAVPGDMIDIPAWPHRVTITEVRSSDDGVMARVFWASPLADGVSWLSERALVRCAWDFRSQATELAYRPDPSPFPAVIQAMTLAQHEAGIGVPLDDEALATLAALITED